MTNKPTDAEIIKALSDIFYGGHASLGCKYGITKGEDRCGLKGCKIARQAIDLINRLKAENERLDKLVVKKHKEIGRLDDYMQYVKTEAIKEFAKEIENNLWNFPTLSDEDGEYDYVCMESLIDFLHKYVETHLKMVGDMGV